MTIINLVIFVIINIKKLKKYIKNINFTNKFKRKKKTFKRKSNLYKNYCRNVLCLFISKYTSKIT